MAENTLITAEEAMKMLQETKSTFYRKVKAGIYPYERVKGKMMFPREAVEVHVQQLTQEPEPLRFVRSTNADLWQRIQTSRKVYGDEDYVPYARVLEWQAINQDIFMSLKDGEKLVGAATIMPMDEEVILALARDEIRERDIPLHAIHKWSDPHISIYIPTIAVTSTGDRETDILYGERLIKETVRWAITLQLQHNIKNWYGIGVTPQGQKLLEHLGFTEVLSVENGARKTYRLDSFEQGTRTLASFYAKLKRQEIDINSPHTREEKPS